MKVSPECGSVSAREGIMGWGKNRGTRRAQVTVEWWHRYGTANGMHRQ